MWLLKIHEHANEKPRHSSNAAPQEEAQCSSNRLPSTLHPTPPRLTCTLHRIGWSVARNWGCLAFRSYFRVRAIFRKQTHCIQELDAHSMMPYDAILCSSMLLTATLPRIGWMFFSAQSWSMFVMVSNWRYLVNLCQLMLQDTFEPTLSHHEEQLLRNFTEQLLARDAFLWVSILDYGPMCKIFDPYSTNRIQSHVDCLDLCHHAWHLTGTESFAHVILATC